MQCVYQIKHASRYFIVQIKVQAYQQVVATRRCGVSVTVTEGSPTTNILVLIAMKYYVDQWHSSEIKHHPGAKASRQTLYIRFEIS